MWLACLNIMRPKAKCIALEHFGSPKKLFFAGKSELAAVPGLTDNERERFADKSMWRADRALETCVSRDIRIIALGDSAYPHRLANIYDPPVVLFVRGKLPDIDGEAAVAIVGTRKASPYGIKMATQMGYEISRGGGLVVTGLAAGIDSAAAVGALRAGGQCVGVLGTAIDEVYPKQNAALYDDVCAAGAIVSEYPPGMPGSARHFPARNRIMSGLSVGVLVVEAPKGSGALITASHANEQGRDVFAVPGNADAVNCQGSNALIRDGAKAVSCAWDILSEYTGRFPRLRCPGPGETWQAPEPPSAPQPDAKTPGESGKAAPGTQARGRETGAGFAQVRRPTDVGRAREEERKLREEQNRERARQQRLEQQLSQLTETQLKLLSAISAPETHIDEIIEAAALPAGVALAELTVLQIKGYVTQHSGKRFSLNIKMK